MYRRRRAVALLALFVTSLGTGATSYWWIASSPSKPLDKEPVVVNSTDASVPHLPVHHPAQARTHAITHYSHAQSQDEQDFATGNDAAPTVQADEHVADDGAPALARIHTTGSSAFAPNYVVRTWNGSFNGGGFAGSAGSMQKRSKPDQGSTVPDNQAPSLTQTDPQHTKPADGAKEHDESAANPPATNLPTPQFVARNDVPADPSDGNGPVPHDTPDDRSPISRDDKPAPVPVPEPGTIGLLVLGVLGLTASRRSRT